MKLNNILSLIFCFCVTSLFSQNTFRAIVKDSHSKELLIGVNATLNHSTIGAGSTINGEIEIKNIPDGKHSIYFSLVGYKKDSLSLVFPLSKSDEVFAVFLNSDEQELEEIIVSSTRTNTRIEDLPQKVEVLGQEEMDEESMLVPGGIGSILGDLSVITIQRTNPVNGNDAVRMQGLDPQYTQLMRDGLPLYEGFSGSLGVLSIPPLDLKQVEIVKGSMSTLYGGGAIAGLINFISKTPVDSPQTTALINVSSLNEVNANTFISRKSGKTGFTLFAGADGRSASDINKDGFSEVPENKGYTFHPRFFYYLNPNVELNAGFTSVSSFKRSGDMKALSDGTDSIHPFLVNDKLFRNTFDFQYKNKFSNSHNLLVKSSFGIFQRTVKIPTFYFKGIQYSSYSEISDNRTFGKHIVTSGITIRTESFVKGKSDYSILQNYSTNTLGAFLQDDWNISEKIMLEAGVREDYLTSGKTFFMPRVAMFYKPSKQWSVRLASGSGYKLPNIFNLSEPASNLSNNNANVVAERSFGINADINYHTLLWDKVGIELNQAFYLTNIYYPLYLISDPSLNTIMDNGHYYVNSYGTDTYIRVKYEEMELYLGYNHTEATLLPLTPYSTPVLVNTAVPFNPKDKFSATFVYEIEGKWRLGPEVSVSSNQYIYGNKRVPDFVFVAAMIERKLKFGSLVLNCENLLDERQSRHEAIVSGTTAAPVFKPFWGPVEGRVINLALKINM